MANIPLKTITFPGLDDTYTIPEASSATPQALGTAAAGSSADFARADHVHAKPTASDIGAYTLPSGGIPASDLASAVQTSLGKADTAYQKPSGGIPAADIESGVIPSVPSAYTSTPSPLGTAAAGSSTAYAKGDHVHAMPSASDVGAAPAVTEVTISTAGAITQALDAGKIYHFTGAVSSLTLTLNAASGQPAQYHFDFDSGSTAATVSITGVTWPDGSFTPEASKHYEVDILNGYAVVMAW